MRVLLFLERCLPCGTDLEPWSVHGLLRQFGITRRWFLVDFLVAFLGNHTAQTRTLQNHLPVGTHSLRLAYELNKSGDSLPHSGQATSKGKEKSRPTAWSSNPCWQNPCIESTGWPPVAFDIISWTSMDLYKNLGFLLFSRFFQIHTEGCRLMITTQKSMNVHAILVKICWFVLASHVMQCNTMETQCLLWVSLRLHQNLWDTLEPMWNSFQFNGTQLFLFELLSDTCDQLWVSVKRATYKCTMCGNLTGVRHLSWQPQGN